jgi:hypothetical protein
MYCICVLLYVYVYCMNVTLMGGGSGRIYDGITFSVDPDALQALAGDTSACQPDSGRFERR